VERNKREKREREREMKRVCISFETLKKTDVRRKAAVVPIEPSDA
jgi:hypothetical protein